MRTKMGIEEENIKDDQSKKDAKINKAVLKMGINVDDGFIFFNEMLYRIMRAQFVTFPKMTFNKVVTISELVTQFKLAELTLLEKQTKTKIDKKELEQEFLTVHQSQPLNLFLTQMFFKTSLTTWRHLMEDRMQKKKWERNEQAKYEQQKTLGKTYTPKEYVKPTVNYSWVEIEQEEILEISCSDEDDNDTGGIDSKSKRSGGGTIKLASDWTKSQKMESPELFRLRARVRMISSSKKFSMEPKEVSSAKKTLN